MQQSIEDMEEQILAIQRSTRTLLPGFIRVHNWCRMNSRWYYKWHLFKYATLVHVGVLLLSIITAFALVLSVKVEPAHAATVTWNGSGTTNNWSDGGNWVGGTAPSADTDTITINTGSKAITVDASAFGTATSLTIGSGYTGTITFARSYTLTGAYSQTGGASSGATVIAPATTLTVGGGFTITGATTFTPNSGTVAFTGGAASIACNNAVFNLVSFNNSGTKTIGSGCTLPLGDNQTLAGAGNITLNGVFTGTGTLTKTSGTFTVSSSSPITTPLSGFSGLVTNILTVNSATAVLDFSNYTTVDFNGTFTLTNGTVSAPANGNSLLVGSGFTLTAGTFTLAATSVMTIDTNNTATINCNSAGLVTSPFVATSGSKVVITGGSNVKTITNCTLPLKADPTVTGTVTLSTNGVLTGTGTLTTTDISTGTLNITGAGAGVQGFTTVTIGRNLVISSPAPSNAFSSSITSLSTGATANISTDTDFSNMTTVDINSAFTWSAGTITLGSSTHLQLASTGTISGTAAFANTAGQVDLDGTAGSNISCSVALTWPTVAIAIGKTLTDCGTIPLGNNPTITGASIVLTGATRGSKLSGTGTLTQSSGVLSLGTGAHSNTGTTGFSGYALATVVVNSGTLGDSNVTSFAASGSVTVAGGTLDLRNISGRATMTSFLTVSSGTLKAPTGTLAVSSTINFTGGTFDTSSGTIGTLEITSAISSSITCGTNTFHLVTFTASVGKIVNADCSLPLGANPSVSNGLVINGTLSGSGTFTTTGSLTLNTGGVLSGFDGLVVGTSFTVAGATVDLSAYTTVQLNSTFSLTSGSFIGPTGTMSVANNFAVTGGTFSSAGNVLFDGSTATITCSAPTTFHQVTFTLTPISATKTIQSGCSLPLGNNPTVVGRLTVNGAISGTGILTADIMAFNSGAALTGFSGIHTIGTMTVAGADIDLRSYTTASFTGITVSSGSLLLPNSGATLSSTFTISGGTVTAPSGTLTLNGSLNLTAGTFVPNGGTVVLAGTGQSITGSWTFANLTKSVTSAGTLTFAAGSTQTITGALTLSGTSTASLSLASSVPGTQWRIDPQGTRSLSYLSVRDSNNINSTAITAGGLTNAGNNSGWNFDAPTISSLGPTTVVDGSSGIDSQPTLTFNLSDSDTSDTVKYQLQIDDSSDFASPVVDYTSSLITQGNMTFIVGQSAGSGAYSAGNEEQELSSGSYYWRVRGYDAAGNVSSYTTANSGSVAFIVGSAASTSSATATPSASPTFSLTKISSTLIDVYPTAFTFSLKSHRPIFYGTGQSGATVSLLAGSTEICRTTVASDNTWKCRTRTLENGDFSLTIQLTKTTGETETLAKIAFTVKDPSTSPASEEQPVSVESSPVLTTPGAALPKVGIVAGQGYVTSLKRGAKGEIFLATFRIQVKDKFDKPLKKVLVALHSVPQEGRTDEQGYVEFHNVLVGEHELVYITPQNATVSVPLSIGVRALEHQLAQAGDSVTVQLHPTQVNLPVGKIDFLWLIWPLLVVLSVALVGYTDFRREFKRMKVAAGHDMPLLDEEMTRIQHSTKTTFPIFAGLHNWLRMKSKAYYWWHTLPRQHVILFGLLLLYIILTIVFIVAHVS